MSWTLRRDRPSRKDSKRERELQAVLSAVEAGPSMAVPSSSRMATLQGRRKKSGVGHRKLDPGSASTPTASLRPKP
jgi:hypothetical protein